MSTSVSDRVWQRGSQVEINIGNINPNTDVDTLLDHFSQYGRITQHNYIMAPERIKTLFISYQTRSMADNCMNNRPHQVDEKILFVKRSLPEDPQHPRDRFEVTKELMVVPDFDRTMIDDRTFLHELREYLSKYGDIRYFSCEREKNFSYILVKFFDTDHVDQVLLDKPHTYNDYLLLVMKYIRENIDSMNRKYAIDSSISDDQKTFEANFDQDDLRYLRRSHSANQDRPFFNEEQLKNEVFRAQQQIEEMNKKYQEECSQIEAKARQQLKTISEEIDKINREYETVKTEYDGICVEYEGVKKENEQLHEKYVQAELEVFELTAYYEQILAEEKAKFDQMQAEREKKLKSNPLSHLSTAPNTNSAFKKYSPNQDTAR